MNDLWLTQTQTADLRVAVVRRPPLLTSHSAHRSREERRFKPYTTRMKTLSSLSGGLVESRLSVASKASKIALKPPHYVVQATSNMHALVWYRTWLVADMREP